jgi:hypothetical protein
MSDVAEHLGKRCVSLDANACGSRILRLDHAAASIQVADYVTDVAVW